MLTLDGVSVVRDGQIRLGPVSAEVDPKGLTVVLGHNGAGKSLFLRTAHGLLSPDAGQVRWHGATPAESRAARGFVFQSTPVMRRSVAQNVEFPLIARGVGRADRARRVAAVLDMTDLSRFTDNPAATLSGGEKQRMALARALVTKPEVILLDEPAASLDPTATLAMEAVITRAHGAGTGIIMSTHDLGQAARLARDVLLFRDGQLVVQTSRDIFFSDVAPQYAMEYRKATLPNVN